MTMKGEEIFDCIKQDLPDAVVDEVTLAAQALANLLLVTEGNAHIDSVKPREEGNLTHQHMCLARGIELGFILGFSAGDGKQAPTPLRHSEVNITKIFEDMRTRRQLIDAGLEGDGGSNLATPE